MIKSDVAHIKIRKKSKFGLEKAVANAMSLINWQDCVSRKKVFLKINGMSDRVILGVNTSPWFFEAVLKEIRNKFPNLRIFFGDSDLVRKEQIEAAVKNWGYKEIAKKYNARFVNLSKQPTKRVFVGKIFKSLNIAKILFDVDIITLPVIKTHCRTTITGSLKNQWGLLPRKNRDKYHPLLGKAIPEINKFFNNIILAVADMSISMEGSGPLNGNPMVCNTILASSDRVALDTVAAKYMGFSPKKIQHIVNSQKIRFGTMQYNIIGHKMKINKFSPPKGKVIYDPYINWMLYNNIGKPASEKICRKTFYGREFNKLINQQNY